MADSGISGLITSAMGSGSLSQNPHGSSLGGSGSGNISQSITAATSTISNTLTQALVPAGSFGR
jgi:hypothetical protein